MGMFLLTLRNMNGVASEASAFPNQTSLLGEQRRDLPADELVAYRVVTIRVELVCVGHVPSPARVAVIVSYALSDCFVLRLLRVKGIAIKILFAADFTFATGCVDLEDCIVRAVDIWI